ncbi:MAG: toxin HipA [Prosthecochloris sp.]|uniref:type II toxin-antitoxin system HipA family toxin n=1 Tax=Prosthecochloris sp. TaxID=290513 RepID=UPI0013C6F928|nr:type II toxin-antitoxin system HipA family toxin [Prosthecochloris sp.]NEX12700.1 toxin HipA [Prosthecochloris sp.]
MSTTAMVNLWGRTIGAVSLGNDATTATFEYDPAFAQSGIEIAPLTMPLSGQLYSFPALRPETFHGLPGLLADSLPDRFGNALIDAWLARSGRTPDSFNAVERLCYTGSRGMGALEYAPAIRLEVSGSAPLEIERLVRLASEVLTHRNNLQVWFHDEGKELALKEILRVGTSAGGARAKAVIAWNPENNEVRSGQVKAGRGFEYWLLKFDGVSGNKDKELEDPQGYGAIEYAYYHMALDAGITMTPCRLFEENGRRHFMTKRFDRLEDGGKLHMQSLCGMAHYDFNQVGTYGYEQALQVIRRLGLPMASVEEQFRRMVFNIVARNQDDHVKNIAFLMDRSGNWSLAPAFDMTYSYQPGGEWTSTHQMTMNGKRSGFLLDDFKACAKSASMKRGCAETIIAEVQEVVHRWHDYAEESRVNPRQRDKIAATLRREAFP